MLRLLLTFLWLILMSKSKLNDSCQQWLNQLGDLDFFTEAQIRQMCHHQKQWAKDRDEEVSKKFMPTTTDNQLKYLKMVEKCTRQNCVREARRKKRAPSKTIRKEIRMFSPRELRDLAIAMNGLKNREIDNITAWDLHTLVHYPDSAPGAHWGPAFLPWHREFLRQFEIALQTEVPTVTLPFWDSTLDQGLPEESDSVLWSDELLGNGNGYVKTGPFADWNTNVFMPLSQIPVKKLYRSTGGRSQDRLMTPRDVSWVVNRKNFSQLTFCHDKTFESMHGLSHVWVGGFMYVIRVSPNDPTFYMHHAFVDNLWEQFRQNSQTREERETQWATKSCNDNHGFDMQMKPFTIQNRDGLSNQYTDEWYEYQTVKHCSYTDQTCDSPYYWCDNKLWRCRSKVVYGGNCTGYEGTQICYNSVCSQGKCIVPPRVKSSMKSRLEDENSVWKDSIWAKTVLVDENGNGIDDELARVTITDLDRNSSTLVFNLGESVYPEVPGTVYLSLPKPRQDSRVKLEARDQYGRYCQAQCLNSTNDRYEVCQPVLNISMKIENSSPLSYTHSMSSRTFLDIDLSIHPRLIRPSLPYMVFACARKLVTSAMILALPETIRQPVSHENYVFFRVSVFRPMGANYQIEVSPHSDIGPVWSSSIQKAASSFDPNIVFVQAPNPELHHAGVRVRVSILNENQRIACEVKCTKKDGSMHECDGDVDLHSDPNLSEEDVFTSDPISLPVLGWNMKGHPTTWRHKVPYLSFHCF